MKEPRRPPGCGLWLVWLLLALFTGEWLLLWLAMERVPKERLLPTVGAIVVITIIGGWVTVYLRVQRRRP